MAEWLALSAAGQLLVRRPPGSIPAGSSEFRFVHVAPLPTVNWVLMTGHEGNMDAVNRVFRSLSTSCEALPHKALHSPPGYYRLWWWPDASETAFPLEHERANIYLFI